MVYIPSSSESCASETKALMRLGGSSRNRSAEPVSLQACPRKLWFANIYIYIYIYICVYVYVCMCIFVYLFCIHPHNAKDYSDAIEAELAECMKSPKTVAVGEMGLGMSVCMYV